MKNLKEKLPDESFLPLEVTQIGRQLFERFRRDASVEMIRLFPLFVEERFGAENGMMRQARTAQENDLRSEKAVLADLDWLGRLPARGQVNAVSDELGTETGKRAESANPHLRRAIDKMAAADPRMLFKDQLRPPLRLMGKMPGMAGRKTGNPIQLPDDCVRVEVKQIRAFANREMSDPGMFLHDEAARKNPGQPDAAGRVQRIAKSSFEEAPAPFPRKEEREEHGELI